MKQLSATALFLFSSSFLIAQSITSSGFDWVPAELTVLAGEPITITVTGNHDMREVSEATWNANATTSNGGFDFLPGTHMLTLDVPGTYWYVCVTHVASFGMKGKIIVETNTGIPETNPGVFQVFPNPANDLLTVTTPAHGTQLSLVDVEGREVLRRSLTGSARVGIDHIAAGSYTALLLDAKGTIQDRQRIAIAR